MIICLWFSVGTRDNAPLSEDAILAGRHTDRLEGRERHSREAGKEQTETDHDGTGREISKGIEGSQICRVFSINAGMLSKTIIIL